VGYWVPGQGYALSAATVHNVAASSALLIGDLRGLDTITSLDTGDCLTIPRIP
jgi:hypothetical protein